MFSALRGTNTRRPDRSLVDSTPLDEHYVFIYFVSFSSSFLFECVIFSGFCRITPESYTKKGNHKISSFFVQVDERGRELRVGHAPALQPVFLDARGTGITVFSFSVEFREKNADSLQKI